MFEHILVPIDGSDFGWAALDQALELATDVGGSIHALYIVDERLVEAPFVIATYPETLLPEVHPDLVEMGLKLQQRLQEQGERILAQARARCEEKGVSCETELAEGNVVRIILNRGEKSNLIVMGRQGVGETWAGPLLGSVFEAVVRRASVPILGVQREARPIRRILVAYDGSERARDALDIAIHLAQHGQRSIVLLTVDDERKERLQAYEEARRRLEEAQVTFSSVYRAGHPAHLILQVAEETQCDLIAMGAYGHTSFLEVLFGSTVDDVMRRTHLPLLICR